MSASELEVGQGNSNAQWQERKLAAVARGQGNATSVYIERGRNAELWDVEGNRYIDFGTGIAVCNTGHSHPKIVAAVQEQLERFSHTCVMVTPYDSAVRLAEQLNELAPGDTPKKSIFVTTGAEAVENAVKVARAYTKRQALIAFGGGFHGRTMMTMALTGKVAPYKAGFCPMPPDVFHAPFPNALQGVSVDDSIHALEQVFKCDGEPERVAAIIVEPVQGEGGVHPASGAYLRRARELADAHGALLGFDEIQCGVGRTGRFLASEHAGVVPDLVVLAKGLAGGVPIGALVMTDAVARAMPAGGHGTTFGGNPLACAAALATLNALENERLVNRAAELGEYLLGQLVRVDSPLIREVRGLGLMVGIETRQKVTPYLKEMMERGVLALPAGLSVIRLLPPLVISAREADEIVARLAPLVRAWVGEPAQRAA